MPQITRSNLYVTPKKRIGKLYSIPNAPRKSKKNSLSTRTLVPIPMEKLVATDVSSGCNTKKYRKDDTDADFFDSGIFALPLPSPSPSPSPSLSPSFHSPCSNVGLERLSLADNNNKSSTIARQALGIPNNIFKHDIFPADNYNYNTLPKYSYLNHIDSLDYSNIFK